MVRVIHGPVHYHDSTLIVRNGEDIADIDTNRTWFTKGTRFSAEREYRFAVSAGRPVTDSFRLDISPELSRLTASWRFGDKWWSD